MVDLDGVLNVFELVVTGEFDRVVAALIRSCIHGHVGHLSDAVWKNELSVVVEKAA